MITLGLQQQLYGVHCHIKLETVILIALFKVNLEFFKAY